MISPAESSLRPNGSKGSDTSSIIMNEHWVDADGTQIEESSNDTPMSVIDIDGNGKHLSFS